MSLPHSFSYIVLSCALLAFLSSKAQAKDLILNKLSHQFLSLPALTTEHTPKLASPRSPFPSLAVRRLDKLKIIGGWDVWRAVMCCWGGLIDYHSCLATVTKKPNIIGCPKAAAAVQLKSPSRSSEMPAEGPKPARGSANSRRSSGPSPSKLSPPLPRMMTMMNRPRQPCQATFPSRGSGPGASNTARRA